jgi:Ca-activated chloride channel family protein
MPNMERPAATPDRKDPSCDSLRVPAVRRGKRALSALFVFAVACSRVAPTETPHAKTPAREAATGARARGEEIGRDEVAVSAPAKDGALRESRGVPAAAAPEPTPAVPKPSAPPPADKKTDALGFARGGLGLSGAGAGGLGLSGASAGGVAANGPKGASRFIGGQGRLGAAHALAAAPTSAPLLVAPGREQAFDTEAYKGIHDNPFRLVTEAPLSTFSVDVDTASYSNMRRFVEEGRLPPPDAVRVEEWVNYFGYADPSPPSAEPIYVATEVAECPWAKGHRLLRVALATPRIDQENVPARNLVFLIDVSGSMEDANKLPLLKRGLALLTRQLRPIDTVSIVVYAGASGLALPPTSGAEQSKILAVLDRLEASGSTNGAEGIELSYELAQRNFKHGGINRVLLATDGDFNVGVTSEGALERLIEEKRKTGVFLTVLGFGEGNLKDSTMETLADKGNGNYAYVDSLAEARKVLVREAGATLVTVAEDVKLQLEFNPRRVQSYRLLGYEDRVLADQDFNDDKKDAGEMGAGHHVTAFYEIVPAGGGAPGGAPPVDPLKYQTERAPSPAATSGELLTVKVRYKPPGGATSRLVSRAVEDRTVPLADASESFRFGAAVVEYGLSLRGAPGFGKSLFASARTLATGALGPDPTGERREFLTLMDRAARL